jgi:hypothetical protein
MGTFCCILSTVHELEESYKQRWDLGAWLVGRNLEGISSNADSKEHDALEEHIDVVWGETTVV